MVEANTRNDSVEAAPIEDDKDMSLEDTVKLLNKKVGSLDTQIDELTDQLKTTQTTLQNLLYSKRLEISGVVQDKTISSGVKIKPVRSKRDPKTGFLHGPAIQKYRDAKILFNAEKYPEAILEFTSFVREYPDHAFASASQFHIGECYFKQNEYRLAKDEFERILVAYDRSSYIPKTLLRLSQTSQQLEKQDKAKSYRQLLFSLFPNSPSAYNARKFQRKAKFIGNQKNKNIQINTKIKNIPFTTAPVPNIYVSQSE